MQIIKKEIANQLKYNSKAKHGIAYEFNVYVPTVDNWIKKNNEGLPTNLTNPSAIEIISKELSIDKEKMLTEL
jgi:tRNA A58 N-methylase Trm61